MRAAATSLSVEASSCREGVRDEHEVRALQPQGGGPGLVAAAADRSHGGGARGERRHGEAGEAWLRGPYS